jgi:hypothetical protein
MKEHNHDEHTSSNHSHKEHSHSKIESSDLKQDPLTETYSILKSGQLFTGHASEDHQHHPIESIREFDYKGSRVVIKTNYNITVNNQPVNHMFL